MNTPEQVNVRNSEVNESKMKDIERVETQLIHEHMRRRQGKDYSRILREYNTPASWYKPIPTARTMYFYDPRFQKYIQDQSKISDNNCHRSPPPSIRMPNASSPRSRNLFNNHQDKNQDQNRLRSVPKLPPVTTNKRN